MEKVVKTKRKNCNCAVHLAKVGKVVKDTKCQRINCPKCGKVVYIEPHKYKLKDGISYLSVVRKWLDGLVSKQLQDALAPKLVPDIEMQYNEYMYEKAVKEIAKCPNLSLYFIAEAKGYTVQEYCEIKNLDAVTIRRKAAAEAETVFDILKVYENLVLKLINWED